HRPRVGAERDSARGPLHEQRLLADAVTREQQMLSPGVPEREGEHARDALEHALAPLLPAVNEHLAVAARAEDMSGAYELVAKRLVVPDLAVVDGEHRPVLVRDRLGAALDVDDAEACVAQHDRTLRMRAGSVRPSVVQRYDRALDRFARRGRRVARRDDSDDAAHGRLSPLGTGSYA